MQQYNDELRYANFRVTKRTFEFILGKVQPEIGRKCTPMSVPVIAKRRLAITLDYLSSTAEYRTLSYRTSFVRPLFPSCFIVIFPRRMRVRN